MIPFPQRIRWLLLAVVLAAVGPLLLVQGAIYYNWFEQQGKSAARSATVDDEEKGGIYRELAVSLGISAATAGFSVALAMILARRLSQDTRRLVEHARALQAGELSHRVHASRITELGELAEALNDSASARQQGEIALRHSEQEYRDLVQLLRVAVVRLGGQGRITFANDYALELFGFSREELLGRPCTETIVPPVDSQSRNLVEMIGGLVSDPAAHAYNENENITKDGRRLWLAWSNRAVVGPDGAVKEVLSAGLDLTEQRRTERELLHTREWLTLAGEAGRIGFWSNDPRTRTVVWSAATWSILGLPAEQKPSLEAFLERVHPDDRAQVLRDIEDAAAHGGAYESEFRAIMPDGGQRWLLLRGQRAQAGGVMRGVLMDVTQRRGAEEDLRRTADELAASNRELEQFAYIASHDLQEPLRMVTGYMALLRRRYEGRLDKDAQEFIAFAYDGAQRMQSLISDLLIYSRLGTRARPFELTDVEAVLREAMANLQGAIRDSGAVVTHDPMPTLHADSSQLLQLLQNLISNAIKFRAPDRPPRVHIWARREDGHWLFGVSDNGIGIMPQHRERIFMIFQRLHTRQNYAGTGIGLAIVKKVVERHGGKVWVESQVGEGSTFYFTIPLRPREAMPADAPKRQAG
jgi:PAS domain S-box-containing protein